MRKILLMTDLPAVGQILKNILENAGIMVFVGKDEEESLKIIETEKLDAVVIDKLIRPFFLKDQNLAIKSMKFLGASTYLIEKIRQKIKNYQTKIIAYDPALRIIPDKNFFPEKANAEIKKDQNSNYWGRERLAFKIENLATS